MPSSSGNGGRGEGSCNETISDGDWGKSVFQSVPFMHRKASLWAIQESGMAEGGISGGADQGEEISPQEKDAVYLPCGHRFPRRQIYAFGDERGI